jgi:hypothetical protein
MLINRNEVSGGFKMRVISSNQATSNAILPTGAMPEHDASESALLALPCRSSLLRKGALPRMLLVLSFVLAFLAFPSESKAAIALVQKATAANNTTAPTTTITATYPAAPTVDHLLIAIAGVQANVTIIAPTSGVWSTAINQSGTPGQAIFYKVALAGESTNVTVTVSGTGTVLGLHIYEYSGTATTLPADGATSANGSGTLVSSGTLPNRPPGNTNDLLIAGLVIDIQNVTFNSPPTNSFVEQADFSNLGSAQMEYAGEDRLSSSTNNGTTATCTRSGVWRGQIAAFRSLQPTAVEMVGYAARAGRDGKTLLQWETGREVNNLGFNIYREDGEKRVRINKSLIVGSGLTARPGTEMSAGRSYAWMASAAQAKESAFWIEEIDFSGRTVWHGPIQIQEAPGGMLTMSAKQQAILEQTATVSDLAEESTNAGVTRPVETFANSAQPRAVKITGALITPQPPINSLKSSVKISLKQEGWYRIGQPQLVAAGLNPSVDPNSLQLFADGAEVPMTVITNNGAFDSTSAIEFYGLPIDTPSTDTHVYTLTPGAAGKRIQSVTGQGGLPPANSFLYTVERKDRTIYVSGIHNGDAENFFGSVVSSSPTDQALTLKNVDAAAVGQATIEVGMQGLSLTPHVVTVNLNGNPIGTISYNSQGQGVAQFAVSNSSLLEGQNLVTLSGQQGVLDLSLVDHIRVSYWHVYAADANALKFTASANQQVTLAGFTSADVKVFDVTNPNVPTKVEASVTSQKSSPAFVVTVAVPGTGTRTLLAIGDDQTRSPLGVVADKATTWKSKSNAAALVIITHDSVKESFKQLQSLRQAQGLKVALVDVEDIYDEFNFGNKSPQAIKDFLAYAKANWKIAPKYVLLAGSASYDPKNYNGLGEYDLVPTKLIDTSFSETASDDWFADFNLDGIPEMAVGRLPVPTSEEAQTTVAKLAAYQDGDSFSSSLLVADDNLDFDFVAANASLAALFPGSITVQQIDRGQIGTAAARQQLFDGIASGQKIVNYVGHGSPSVWRDNLLTAADALALTNTGRYPVFISMTCLNGEFQHPELNPLASALMNSREGGAIAVWASSGFTEPAGQAVMNQQFYTLLFQTNQPIKGDAAQVSLTLGDITTSAKSSVSDPDIRRTWILFGDPSMRVK